MAHVVGPQCEVFIEQSIRVALGILPGSRTIQRLVDDHIEIHFFQPLHRRSLKGALRPILSRITRAAELDDADEAWASACNAREVRRGQ